MHPLAGHRHVLASAPYTFYVLKVALLTWNMMEFRWYRFRQG
jgi:hypothetical protein